MVVTHICNIFEVSDTGKGQKHFLKLTNIRIMKTEINSALLEELTYILAQTRGKGTGSVKHRNIKSFRQVVESTYEQAKTVLSEWSEGNRIEWKDKKQITEYTKIITKFYPLKKLTTIPFIDLEY